MTASDSLRVLVADDNRDGADSAAVLLELWGYHVTVAYDGESALTAALADKPHILLLDVRMPHMDGYEVARRVRAEPALEHTRIIAVSGLGQPEDVRRSLESGCHRHLLKPVELDELREILSEVEGLVRGEGIAAGVATCTAELGPGLLPEVRSMP